MIRKARKPSVLKPGFAYEPGHSSLPFGEHHDEDGGDHDGHGHDHHDHHFDDDDAIVLLSLMQSPIIIIKPLVYRNEIGPSGPIRPSSPQKIDCQ